MREALLTKRPANGGIVGLGLNLFSIKRCIVVLFVLFQWHISQAAYRWVLDYDGSIVRDADIESPWKTPWVMVRVDNLSNSAQLDINPESQPKTIEVSFAEYLAYEAQWAKGDRSLASLNEVELINDPYLQRPKIIIPGIYRVEPSQTFMNYRSNPEGENFILRDAELAFERIQKEGLPPEAFFGKAMPLLQQGLSHPLTVGDVHIFTARTQNLEEFLELFELWKERGFIQHSEGTNLRGRPVHPTIHNLQGHESLYYGRVLTQRKAHVVAEIARELAFSARPKTLDYSSDSRQSDKIVETHTIIIAEDDPRNFRAIAEKVSELSTELELRNIKYVLVNTSADEVIKNMSPPFNLGRWLVFDNGFIRSATENEIKNYTGEKVIEQSFMSPHSTTSRGRLCSRLF